MKAHIQFVLLLLAGLTAACLWSCEKDKQVSLKGSIEFSVNIPDVAGSRSLSAPDSILYSYQLMVSVTDLQGNAVVTDEMIPLYSFGTEFVSEKIELNTGEYKLVKFMVINSAGEVIYAAPVEGSALAWLCNKPLPIAFSIQTGLVTKVIPQVLAVGDQSPDQFGYAAFGIQIIRPLEFYALCVLDNPLLMAPTQITTAVLTVKAPNGWHYTYKLDATVNHIVIQGGSAFYGFILQKEGYATQTFQVQAGTLMATNKDNPFMMKIPWGGQVRTLVLQPGPDGGKDAMISNLEPDRNFGGYKYFEATFLTEPVLTVMRSNRSLIYFNLDSVPKTALIKSVKLRLTYDLPVPFDPDIFPPDRYPVDGTIWYGGVFQQIIEPWDEYKVTWNTQPKTTEFNQVYLPPFIRNANMIEVDVTRLFVSPSATASVLPNWGMLFRLWPTDNFPGFRFVSSDWAEAYMRPMLTITYALQ